MKRYRNRIGLIVFIGGIILYLAFYLVASLVQQLQTHHTLFLSGSIFLIAVLLLMLSIQNKSKKIRYGSILLLLISVIEIILSSLIRGELLEETPYLDAVIHFVVSLSIIVIAYGLYEDFSLRKKQEYIHQATFDYLEVVIMEYESKTDKVYFEFSPRFQKSFGLSAESLEMTLAETLLLIHPDDQALLEEFQKGKVTGLFDFRIRFPKIKEYAHILIRYSYQNEAKTILIGFDTSFLDITKTITHNLNKERALMLDNLQLGLSECEVIRNEANEMVDYSYIYVNKAFEKMTLIPESQVVGKQASSIFPTSVGDRVAFYQQVFTDKKSVEFDRFVPELNKYFTFTAYAIDENKFVTIFNDITELVQTNKLLKYQSIHNELTGLLNHKGLYEAVLRAKNSYRSICFFIDIRNYEVINDYYGIHIGEELLKIIAVELNQFSIHGNLVSRYSGDQFVVMLLNPTNKQIAKAIEKMNQLIFKTYQVETITIQLKKHIGYAVTPDDTPYLEQSITYASLAMKKAADHDHNVLVHYEEYMSQELDENIRLAGKVYQAIQSQKMEIHFQQIVRADQNKIELVEALARWYDEELGYVRPDYFLEIARKSNMGDLLEEYLIERTFREYSKLKKNPIYQDTRLSINLSPASFLRDTYLTFFLQKCLDYQMEPSQIVIELSENTFVSNKIIYNERIAHYRQAGFKIAIDDFGKQYSSLSLLGEIAYDIIKIDRIFINRIQEIQNKEIVKTIIQIAKHANKQIIAEGIETETEKEILLELGCSLHQGYLYHRPEKVDNTVE